jgi:stage III sporulation protein AC
MVFKIAAIGILVAVLSQVLERTGREDMATLTGVAGLVLVLLMVVNLIAQLFSSVKSIFGL